MKKEQLTYDKYIKNFNKALIDGEDIDLVTFSDEGEIDDAMSILDKVEFIRFASLEDMSDIYDEEVIELYEKGELLIIECFDVEDIKDFFEMYDLVYVNVENEKKHKIRLIQVQNNSLYIN